MVPSHRHLRLVLAGLTLALLPLCGVLSVMTHNSRVTYDSLGVVLALAFGAVGYIVARHQPHNPIGWIFLVLAPTTILLYAVRLYLVLDYGRHGGSLPLGAAAATWDLGWSLSPLIIGLTPRCRTPGTRLRPGDTPS